MGALDGFTLVDLTAGVCGPSAAARLADAGMSVIKIEPPGRGDHARHMGPPFLNGHSPVFVALNRNKRSVAVDIETGAGRALVRRLIDSADVLLEDFGPGRASSYGFGHEELSAEHPELISCSVSAFGEHGPMRDMPEVELVVQAMAEYTRSLGVIGEPPVRLGADVAGLNTGVFASQAVCAALFHRLRTGAGQRVSVSMLRVLLHMRGIMWAARSNPDDWHGFHLDHYTNPPEIGYEASDGRFFFGLRRASSEDFDRLMIELGLLDYVEDPRFGNYGRDAAPLGRHVVAAKPILEEAFRQRSVEELRELIKSAGGDAAEFNDYPSVVDHRQIDALECFEDHPQPWGATVRGVRPVARFSKTPSTVRCGAPLLGQHTDDVLAEIGVSATEADALRRDGVIQ